MNSEPIAIRGFDDDCDAAPAAATQDEIEYWKEKLVLATNHGARNAALKSMISKEIGARVKHYNQIADTLARAIRDKSTIALEHAFGRNVDQVLTDLKPRELYCDSLSVWIDNERSEREDQQ